MAELPILPLKTDALLADTGHLSAEEFGAYCRILFTMWRHDARLPDDADELARIAGVSAARWSKIAERVRRPLTSAGGTLSQKRLSSTWLDVQALRAKRATAANKRWGSNTNANGQAQHMQLHSNRNANQNQISKPSLSELDTAREEKPHSSARVLATAPNGGALAREPSTEPAAKRPSEVSRQELEAVIGRRNVSRETSGNH